MQSDGRRYSRNRVDIRDALESEHEHRSDHSVLSRQDVTPVANVTVLSNDCKTKFGGHIIKTPERFGYK